MLKRANINRNGIIRRAEMVKRPSTELTRSRGGLITKASTPLVDRMAPRPFSPFYEETNLQMPRERPEQNAWARHYYDSDPLIGNCIDLHSTYPLSSFGVKCESPEIEAFFNRMLEKLNFNDLIYSIAREYFIIGEVFPLCQLDEDTGEWAEVLVQNPDFIDVKKHLLTNAVISLKPDAELQRIITSSDPDSIALREQLDPDVIQYVAAGRNIPLPAHLVSHIARKSSPYNVRGTSILTRVYKDLMYRDILREAQFTIANNHVTPLKIVKVGMADGSYRPGEDELLAVRGMLEQATYDTNFTIVTHMGFEVSYVGATGQILPLDAEFEHIEDRILTGLFTSKAFTHGEGPTYANASVALEVLQQRYVSFRNMIERWLERKIFAPISRIQDFTKYRNGVKELIIPKVNWQRINLKNNREYQGALEGLVRDNKVSLHSLMESLDLNYDNEIGKIKSELEDMKEIAYKLQTPYMGKENINVSSPGIDEMGGKPAGEAPEMGGGGGGADLGGGDMGGGGDLGGGGGEMDLGGGGMGDLGSGGLGGESGGGEAGGGAPPPAV
jgi:hypothetical protein